jgi:K+-sensing histidine kinase KdpD
MALPSPERPTDPPPVPWKNVVQFVRQLSHDVRNDLNAAELQSAYLTELAEGEEMKNEVQRLRGMVTEIATSLQRLSAALAQTNLNVISYRAEDFVDDVKQKLGSDFASEAAKVNWDVQLKDEIVQIDPQLLPQAVIELFANAFRHEKTVTAISAKASVDNARFIFELREPKARFELSTEQWGREPLRHIGQGHYGLGLNRVRSIVEAHSGELRATYDGSTLVTRMSLPLARKTRS